MKRFLKILSLGTAALMLAGSLAACSGKPGAGLNLISDGKLVMGTNAYFPPFEYKEGNEVVGVDVDIVKAIAKKLDLTFEVKGDIEFESLPESLKTRDIDLIAAGFTALADREEAMDFSDSYYTALQTVIVRADSAYTTLADIKDKGLKIGGQSGTTGLSEAEKLTDKDKAIGYTNGALAVQDLINGNLDVVIIDNNPAKEYKEQHSSDIKLLENQFEEEHYVIGIPKGNKKLLEAVNNALKDIKEDGTLQKILDNYIK